jgi:DNA repair protein RadA/Sms
MAKVKTEYKCTNCSATSPKWSGQCMSCKEWHTLEERDKPQKNNGGLSSSSIRGIAPRTLSEAREISYKRIPTGIQEVDRVLGGGIVPGALMLLGGEPGIGKSTLTLQVLNQLGLENMVYVAGEESMEQIKIRADRMNCSLDNLYFIESNILEEVLNCLENLEKENDRIGFLVIDSIQTIKTASSNSFAGSTSNIRHVTEAILNWAKSRGVPVLIIGHVTKDGEIAGPKVLEHLVDTVLYIEGDRVARYRFLKSMKNRFGSTEEVGLFHMNADGLREVADPAKEFLEERSKELIGSSLTCTMEGNRPFIVEVQALTAPSSFGYPKRSAVGFDNNRLAMIIAVLQKYHGVDLSQQDVFVNVSGGFKIKDTAADLAVMNSLVGSYKKKPQKLNKVYIGEVSLTGETRKCSYYEQRVQEIKRLGFKKADLGNELGK